MKISKKLFLIHPKDFVVREKLNEIFIVGCDFTGKINQLSSVTPTFEHFKTLKPTLAKHDNVSKKTQKFEIRDGMTRKGCASQECCNMKKFRFFSEHAGKIPSTSPFYPSKRLFR